MRRSTKFSKQDAKLKQRSKQSVNRRKLQRESKTQHSKLTRPKVCPVLILLRKRNRQQDLLALKQQLLSRHSLLAALHNSKHRHPLVQCRAFLLAVACSVQSQLRLKSSEVVANHLVLLVKLCSWVKPRNLPTI